ncbi:MAG: SpoIIE family protein phosphatase [Treponema sp.]|nr:SpoIIE family protein phosphatase [Treponema sp.]
MKQLIQKILKHSRIFTAFFAFLFFCPLALFAGDLYWEEASVLIAQESRFPTSVNTKNGSYVFWEEIDSAKNEIWISCRFYTDEKTFIENRRFAGPASFYGDVPNLYSAASTKNGTIVMAMLESAGQIAIFSSNNSGRSFVKTQIHADKSEIAPRLYENSNGSIRLFLSTVKNDEFGLAYSDSTDGKKWSNLKSFAGGMLNPFTPYQIILPDCEFVVYQAQTSMKEPRYQLYSVYSSDGGKSWSSPQLITNQKSLPDKEEKSYLKYTNQRPCLFYYKKKIYLAWQRSSSLNSSIWIAEITKKGINSRSLSNISETYSEVGNASRPIFFEYDGGLYVEWFDTRSGKEDAYFAKLNGFDWDEQSIVKNDSRNMFPFPMIMNKKGQSILAFVWQETLQNDRNRLGVIVQDVTVASPNLTAISYKEGRRSTKKDVQIQVSFPNDVSGIAGYSYTWGKNNSRIPPTVLQHPVKNKILNLTAPDDGNYTLSLRIMDNAGNWSEAESISYYRDITPPKAPKLHMAQTDSYGFMESNTFKFDWDPSPDDDVAGYNYRLEYLASVPSKFAVNKTHSIMLPDDEVIKEVKKLQKKYEKALDNPKPLSSEVAVMAPSSPWFTNRRNGIYALYVSAVDGVGNVSEPASCMLVLNKFMPRTFVTAAGHERNSIGEIELSLTGGGFTYEGAITKMYIDKDGQAPYDLTLTAAAKEFQVDSDSKISKIKIGTNLDAGSYKVLLYHTDRGLYKSESILDVIQTGTVKIQSEYQYVPEYTYLDDSKRHFVNIYIIVLILLLILITAGLILFILALVKITKEKKLVREEIKSLISGENMPKLKHKVSDSYAKRGSLRTKLVGFTVVLLILVVLGITLQNGFKMINTQRQTLAEGLQNRIDVFMESLASGAKNFIPAIQDTELSLLLEQQSALPEAEFVTVLGVKRESGSLPDEDSLNRDTDVSYVWASKDVEIERKVESPSEYASAKKGTLAVTDPVLLDIVRKYKDLDMNGIAAERIAAWAYDLKKKSAEYTSIALAMDEASVERKKSLSDETKLMRSNIDRSLRLLSVEYSYSLPGFDSAKLDTQNTEYIFFKPVFQYSSVSDKYLIGIIVLKVSTEELIHEINSQRRVVVYAGLVSALVAIALGVLGSMLLASFIVRPIKKLEYHLEEVGTLMTKSVRERQRLEKKYIEIKSKDEIGRLGDVVNKMTLSAGAAAYEEFLQQDGKLVQERFIPLMDGEGGRKLPLVKLNEEKLDLFAFYKGDSAVSGDYFDYRKLDDHWYVFIKCDISGHGVPAALLVSVVATKFKDFYYFSNWTYEKQGLNLKKFVSAVNDFIFDLGTRGKFSTINISLYNKDTGELYVCNAGDNKVHIFEKSTRKLKEIVLANTPTAGGVSTDLVEMTAGGYKVEKLKLNPGDIFYLYTDGIDESERLVRNPDFSVRQITRKEHKFNPETKTDEEIETVDDEKEQFGAERVTQVIEAVLNKKKFRLEKKDNPISYEILEFDFTNCQGTIDESIIALAAVERVFRLVKFPAIRKDDEIEMDKTLDEFLKKHFNLYKTYCIPADTSSDNSDKSNQKRGTHKQSDEEKQRQLEDPNVTRYSYISEDKQADDITLVAIKRPE